MTAPEFGWPAAFAVAAVCVAASVLFWSMKDSFSSAVVIRKYEAILLVLTCPQCRKQNKVRIGPGQPICGACKTRLLPFEIEWTVETAAVADA